MAHLSEGELRRMVDDPARRRDDAAHLESCAQCQALYKSISEDARSVASLLAVPEARVDVSRAYARVMAAKPATVGGGFRFSSLLPRSRPMSLALVAAVAAVALLAAVAAENFKTNSTPSTVAPVPVTVADMQALSDLSNYGTVTWTQQPEPQVVNSAADASAAAGGMQPPVVKDPPSTSVTYVAIPQAQAVFTFSADKAAAAAAQQGKALPAMPAGMDGAKLTVTVGPAIGEVFGNLSQTGGSSASDINLPLLIVGKSAVPHATSTQVTVKQMESVILAQPGITPGLKAAIKALDPSGTTLPIPIPVQYATATTVTVQGVSGVALGDNTGAGAGVVWIKNGIVYAVAGPIKQSDAIKIA
ncbi:MAG TPA: hypothetical protein VHQ03_00260, partial [Candidatus Dormibacteraeota bacterium]|nr:hypothetical protein [Candidatus Dormibacteraeota bacterium]